MPLAAGQTLSHYELLGPVGAGAMGEVWRARDTRLEREVAIKVLPAELACNAEGLQRFEREARTLAGLSHPGLAHVYGIDRVDDTCFIAMELVPGEDLAARLSRGALPVAETIDVCRQIAEAVEAAHEAGVIHRDLKPANVVLTPEGKAKVLDFGLAKPTGVAPRPGSTHDSVLTTEAGRLLGTPTYMAPEQARGKPIDKRVDVWAFGCVLYECLTGRRAFPGETISDVLAAVLEHKPDLTRLPAGTPAHVRRLLERCLDKAPRTRLRDVGEARIALERGDEVPDPVELRRGVPLAPILAIAGLAAAAGYLVGQRLAAPIAPTDPLERASIRKLTEGSGTVFDVAISPEGDAITYGSIQAGVADLWVARIDSGEPQNLTQGHYPVQDDLIRNVGFDGSGSRVWLLTPGTKTLAAPRSGGVFEPFLEVGVGNMDWTRDGSRIVYHTNEEGDPIHVRETNAPQGDPIRWDDPGIHQHFPTWSVDEEWILFVQGSEAAGGLQLWRMRPDGSAPEQLTFELRSVAFPTPLDEDTVLFVGHDAGGSGPWLWSLDLTRDSPPRRVAFGTQQFTSLSASADGHRVVATVADPQAVLWQVPIRGEPVQEESAALLPGVPSVRALAPRYGGGDLFYMSSRGSADGLWRLQGDRAREIWSGIDEPLLFRPSLSPDSRFAALVRRQGSHTLLAVVSVETGQTLHVFGGPVDVRGGSSWSPDGDWIVIGGVETDESGAERPGLFRFPFEGPAQGGSAQRLATGDAMDPAWSPTEDLIVYSGEQIGPTGPLLAVRSDGTPVELSPEELRVQTTRTSVRFLPDGSGLVFMIGAASSTDFVLLDLESGRTRRLTELDKRGAIHSFDVTPDGQAIVFDRIQLNSDVVLIELPERGSSL